MRRWMTRASLCVLVAVSGCQGLDRGAARPDQEQVAAEVFDTLHAFEAAQRTLDADALIAFLHSEFTMMQDGQRVSYEGTVHQMRNTLPTLREFEPRFEDVRVLVLARDVAVTSMRFRDVMTSASGEKTEMWGPSTLVWRRDDGVWRILFADSDHYEPEAVP